jgi:hypothetical protein
MVSAMGMEANIFAANIFVCMGAGAPKCMVGGDDAKNIIN